MEGRGSAEDHPTPEADDALRSIRAVCARCGADVQVVAGRVTTGGSCPICGGYELTPASEAGLDTR